MFKKAGEAGSDRRRKRLLVQVSSGNPGRIFTIAAGVSAPPALLLNSEPYRRPDPARRDSLRRESTRGVSSRRTRRALNRQPTAVADRGRREKESGLVGFPIRGGEGVWLSAKQWPTRSFRS